MNTQDLKRLLDRLARGQVSTETVLEKLKTLPFEDLGFAQVDHHRPLRSGMPEVIYCEGKTADHIVKIARELNRKRHNILATRLRPDLYRIIRKKLPPKGVFHETARVWTLRNQRHTAHGLVAVVTAGTSDIPVAEEAAVTLEILGSRVERIFDVGVAGLHRLLNRLDLLRRARVLVVVAGMDGALASVVGGLMGGPVVGVPTSVGYGASFGGVAALLTMLNSCAPGVAVVNIDNGFGAACLAHRINLLGDSEASR